MTSLLLLIFGAFTGSLLSVLIGFIGSRRRIGFGWAFVISLLLTPLVGLIVTLISEPLPDGDRRWGCIGAAIVLLCLLCLAAFLFLFVTGGIASMA